MSNNNDNQNERSLFPNMPPKYKKIAWLVAAIVVGAGAGLRIVFEFWR